MLLVMKFGGTSVADIERIRNSARHVKREVDGGNRVAVVVSAMAGHTNQLVAWTREANPVHDPREYDAVVSSGEQITAGLMAIILQSMGIKARSWQGWQIPLITDGSHGVARIDRIEGDKLLECLNQGEVGVVAGFQGVSEANRITTLGRGGSDTTAVALAAALNAGRCDIYTDVEGVYTTDPRIVHGARRLSRVSYEEMLEMASLGAKVLQTRSVELAMARGVRVQVRSSFDTPELCEPARAGQAEKRGTLVCDETEMLEHHIVSGIAYAKDEAKIMVLKIEDKPGVAASIFMPLADANINVDMIVQNISEDGRTTDLTFTVAAAELPRALQVLRDRQDSIRFSDLRGDTDVVKVSVIGVGMRSHAGVAAKMFHALAEKQINIQAISTSEIKISVLVGAAHTEAAVKTLHNLFGLDRS
ncbi:MAG: aspartate kinase [Rhodomicrobium sp.]